MTPGTPDSYRLLLEGATTLAAIESRGIRIDTGRLRANRVELLEEQRAIKEWATGQPEWRAQTKRYGSEANLGSREQVAAVLFGDMGMEYTYSKGAKGQYLLDANIMEDVVETSTYAKQVGRYLDIDKVVGTYVDGILREVTPEGRLHAFFNLHKVVTFRSSSDGPNMQNMPVRKEELAKVIREAFIPDPGCAIVEIDYGGAEVKVAACYHKDPRMVEYIETKYDFHREMAAECFKIPGKVSKEARFVGKNSFVFAEFYGDYYRKIAPNLYRAARRLDAPQDSQTFKDWGIKAAFGPAAYPDLVKPTMVDHLAASGLGDLDSFTRHIQEVERRFWQDRFQTYDAWRTKWWERYKSLGYCQTLTGFNLAGNFIRNEVINYPVQGSAFHMLLQSLVEIEARLRAAKSRARIVTQIHDSALCNVPIGEVAWFTAMAKEVMCDWLRKKWPWIIVPLEVEAEASATSWYDKKPLEIGCPLC